jgi:hypothetical protein
MSDPMRENRQLLASIPASLQIVHPLPFPGSPLHRIFLFRHRLQATEMRRRAGPLSNGGSSLCALGRPLERAMPTLQGLLSWYIEEKCHVAFLSVW